jgi:hypothetical protein
LNSARTEENAGRAGMAFQLLQKTDYSIDEALGVQAAGPPSQNLLTPNFFLELTAGIAIGFLVTFLVMRRENQKNQFKPQAISHRARPRIRETKTR